MKRSLMAILAVLAVCPISVRAGDRLMAITEAECASFRPAPFSVDDVEATPCVRYRRRGPQPASFIFEVSPWGILSSPDVDGFSTSGTINGQPVTETLDGTGSWMPNMHVGFGVNTRPMDFDFLFGVGYIGNDAFGSGFSEVMFSPRFRLGPYVRFGPFVSLMAIGDAEWYDESDIELEGGAASRAGISFAAGSRKVFFNLAFSYLDFEYDVDTSEGTWTASSDKLDMSGWAVQMGVYCRF